MAGDRHERMGTTIDINQTMCECAQEIAQAQVQLWAHYGEERAAIGTRRRIPRSMLRRRRGLEAGLWRAQQWMRMLGTPANDLPGQAG